MISSRVLLIRDNKDNKISVKLDNIFVNRGEDLEAGSRTYSAGLWIDHASSISLDHVEVTGKGRGHGIAVYFSDNVSLNNIHDLLWSLYKSEPILTYDKLKEFKYNDLPIYKYDPNGKRFGVTRIQEQINALFLAYNSDVTIKNIDIERIGIKIDEEFVPWQTDGISVADID